MVRFILFSENIYSRELIYILTTKENVPYRTGTGWNFTEGIFALNHNVSFYTGAYLIKYFWCTHLVNEHGHQSMCD